MFKKTLMIWFACAAPFFGEMNVLAISGSTRDDSMNKKLAKQSAQIAREMGAKVTFVDLKDYPMPFYDGDLESEQGMPKNAKKLRNLMIQSQAVIIASPEYNASISAVLKNAIDWTTRSEQGGGSHEAYEGKKFALMSASPGQMGGARGLKHLRAVIEDVGGKVLEKQVSVARAHTLFNEQGMLTDETYVQELNREIEDLVSVN